MAIETETKKIEKIIGYEFNNEDLLKQAFIRKSYSIENGGENNEILEFIGDKALDLAVIKIMMDEYGEIISDGVPKFFKTKLDEGDFTEMKKEIVEKKSLSKVMDKLGFHYGLVMGQGDIKQNIKEEPSVKEDLFEAILGAVTLDCNWDVDQISKVVLNMLDFAKMSPSYDIGNTNYVGLLQEWSQKNGYGLPKYWYSKTFDDTHYMCTAKIEGSMFYAQGFGKSESIARMEACKNCYYDIKRTERIKNKYIEAVGMPDESRALLQINELVQKGLVSKPKYEFIEDYDDNGNPVWECDLTVDEFDFSFSVMQCSNKQDAKRMCCYDLLVCLIKHN